MRGRDGRTARGAAEAACRAQYGLSAYDAEVLTAKGRPMVAYFEAVAKARRRRQGRREPDERPHLPGAERAQGGDRAFPISAAQFADFLKETGPLSKQDRVELFKFMLDNGADLRAAMEKTGIKPQTFDEATLRAAVVEAIGGQPASGGRLQGRQDRGREQDQGRGDEGEQGRAERRGPAAAGRGTGKSPRLAPERADAFLVLPERARRAACRPGRSAAGSTSSRRYA